MSPEGEEKRGRKGIPSREGRVLFESLNGSMGGRKGGAI